jgi:hypothetical protein
MNQLTKKFPVSIGHEGWPMSESEFLIPRFSKLGSNAFIGIESGKESMFGAVFFIGMAVDAEEVLTKLKTKPDNPKQVLSLLNNYLTQLQTFKIGNIISIAYKENGQFSLIKEFERIKANKVTPSAV